MFIILMTESHISIPDNIIDTIKYYYNNKVPSLIHSYKHGLCITQNINKTSNISIYVRKKILNTYNLQKEFSFYNKEDISILSDFKIINNNNNNYIYVNHELNKISFIQSCNFCKNIQEIEFTETSIPNNIMQNIDFGWLKEKISDFKGKCSILISDQINGIVIRIIDNEVTIYLNIVV